MQNETASQWREVDIALAGPDVANPHTDIDAWVTFTHSNGRQLRRPVFWDGGTTYRVRFASTDPAGEWQWRVYFDRPSSSFSPARGTFDRYEPSLLICAETTPAWVAKQSAT